MLLMMTSMISIAWPLSACDYFPCWPLPLSLSEEMEAGQYV